VLIDTIESVVHAAFASADKRQKLLEDKAVAIAFIARERRRILEMFAREEAEVLEEFKELEAKLAKARDARDRVAELLDR
jgi:VIT1/CCC1 family predicted Fe2+/Mn2+ transporter